MYENKIILLDNRQDVSDSVHIQQGPTHMPNQFSKVVHNMFLKILNHMDIDSTAE